MNELSSEKLSPSLEDYLEAIYLIQSDKAVARIKDIASKMEVSSPSVTGAIKSLKKLGLVEHAKYGYVELSEEGKERAAEIFRIHSILTNFLHKILGMDYYKAEADACRIEHILEPETVKRISDFLDFSANPSSYCEGCAAKFKEWRDESIERLSEE